MWWFKKEPLLEAAQIADVIVLTLNRASLRANDLGLIEMVEKYLQHGARMFIIDAAKVRSMSDRHVVQLLRCYARVHNTGGACAIVKPTPDTGAGRYWHWHVAGLDILACDTREQAISLVHEDAV